MADPLGELARGDFRFAVYPDGEVHRVEALKGDSPVVLVCRVYGYSSSEWPPTWVRNFWRPWIDQQARRTIAEAESED